jgi:hypothetical protein
MRLNPTINAKGGDQQSWMEGLREAKYEFEEWFEEWMRHKEEKVYA